LRPADPHPRMLGRVDRDPLDAYLESVLAGL
jgi:hypothetical protein